MVVKKIFMVRLVIVSLLIFLLSVPVLAANEKDEKREEIAKELQNPVAEIINVPFMFNYDPNFGQNHNGSRLTLDIQPVIPFQINSKWELISRTIIPVVTQTNLFAGSGSQSGLGDITQSFFFSPKDSGDLIWGIGPIFLLPIATDSLLGEGQWGLGPTGVVLEQKGPWTYGILANQIWSVAGNPSHSNVNLTGLQPFLSYTTDSAATVALQTESTYNWVSKRWAIPLEIELSQVLMLKEMPVSVGLGGKYWLDGPAINSKWVTSLSVTLVFLK